MKRVKQTPAPCRYPGCAELVREGGYCSKHKRRPEGTNGGRRGSEAWHGLYYKKRWKDLRTEQLIKEPFCRICTMDGRRTPAEDVDHIIPHRGNMELFNDPSNLQSLCHSCHSRKTASENENGPAPAQKEL